MLAGNTQYPYEKFREDLASLGEILDQDRILRLTGEWWNAADYEGEHSFTLKVGSYFAQRCHKPNEVLDLSSVYCIAVEQIEEHIDLFAPGLELDELIDAKFEPASTPLLRALHAVLTQVDIAEWGDDRQETFEFVVELARSRFGYAP